MSLGKHNVSSPTPTWLAVRQLSDLREENARFWEKVEVGPAGGCWLWQAGKTRNGYGQFWWGPSGRPEGAHRVAWILTRGAIPEGQEVMHSCDTPLCCNPTHLSLGSHADNVRDASRKGHLRCARPNAQKLTAEQVEFIRDQVATGPRGTANQMAERFGVTRGCISQLVRGVGNRRQYDAPLRPRLVKAS